MRTQKRIATWHFLLMLVPYLLICGCEAKCQQPQTTAYTSITATDWRLVSTTDPSPDYKNISNTTTIIMTFKNNYTGEVDSLQDNNRTPALGFAYNVSNSTSSNGLLKITYYPINDPSSASGQATEYSYNLSTELDLTETGTGYYYHFVPFEGIVLPDQVCTF